MPMTAKAVPLVQLSALLAAVLLVVALAPQAMAMSTSGVPGMPSRTRHDYKLAVKRPYFIVDNHTMPFYDYYGSSLPAHDHIRLTPSSYGLKGAVWSKNTCPYKEWQADIRLEVSGVGAVGGDGLAFWYTKDRGIPYTLSVEPHPSAVDPTGSSLGPVFGSADRWDGLAVMLDTYDSVTGNRNNPLITGVLNDGKLQYAGRQPQDIKAAELGSCYADYRNTQFPVHLRVIHQSNSLQVYISKRFGDKMPGDVHDPTLVEWQLCFHRADVTLPSGYYFGVSSSAGIMPDNHDLISLEVHEVNPPHKKTEDQIPHHDASWPEQEKIFEDMRRKVEDAREKQELMHDMHSPGGSPTAGTTGGTAHQSPSDPAILAELVKLQSNQFRMIEQLDVLAGGHGVEHAGVGGGIGGAVAGTNNAALERKLDDIQHSLTTLSAAMENTMQIVQELGQQMVHAGNPASKTEDNVRMARLLDEISNKVSAVHRSTDRFATNQGLGTSGQQDGTAGGHSYLALLLLFLVGQALVSAVRAIWKSRRSDQGKKFI